MKPNEPVKSIANPGSKGTGHTWAYLPDVGEAMAQLMDRDDQLADF